MLSLSDTLSFSFCKRSVVLGAILLFAVILSIFGLGELVWYSISHDVQPNPENFKPIVFGMYMFQILGYSILFSYLYIRAKQDIYSLTHKFSGEFFIRVFLTFFCISVLTSVGLYFSMPYIQKFLTESTIFLLISKTFPWQKFIFNMLLPALGILLFVGYLLSAVYMAYVMHFNFQRFFYKFLKVLTHPVIYLQIVGFSVLFVFAISLPILGLYLVMKSFSSQDVLMSFSSCIMGQMASTSLIVYSVVFGAPIAIFCLLSKSGRMAFLLFTLLYMFVCVLFWIAYKQSGIPFVFSIPVSAVLYTYLFFFIFCLMFVLSGIILPTGLIHLMVQGAFLVHKTFEPGIASQSLTSSTSNEERPKKDDGWL